ncbi:MAG: V-type ATPase subunit [Candidatus Aminicenantes bacterium]
MSRLDYAYAVGRVRALEKDLISRAVFWEAAEEKDFSSALKVIFDAGTFLVEKIAINDSRELDSFLTQEKEALIDLVSDLLLEEEIRLVIGQEDTPHEALEVAEMTGYDFFCDYFRRKIDLGNLKIFLRAKYSETPKEQFSELVLKGGYVERRRLIDSYELSFSEIGDILRTTAYQDIWVRAVDTLVEKETFVDLERGIEDHLMRFLHRAKYVVFGPEPVFAYALGRKRELNLVRLLGVGKMNLVPTEILKARISETYV